jgi:uncharacterized protein YbcI
MSDSDTARGGELASEISASLGGLWKRYTGHRPAEIETTIDGPRVAVTLKDAVSGFDDAISASEAAELEKGERRLTVRTFRQDAISAVSAATHRKVMAFVSKHDEKSNSATEVFILDRPLVVRPSLFLDRREAKETPSPRPTQSPVASREG